MNATRLQPLQLQKNACVFSIDVEDWFHIMDLRDAPRLERWGGLPSVVERNFFALLDMADAKKVRATCFFLGWVAEKYPALVREAAARGHEVASHGYAHDLVYELTPERFLADVDRARKLLEDQAGRRVSGYRAPGFSVTGDTPWFFEKLAQAGYAYSSSVFPAARGHGGMQSFTPDPCIVETAAGAIREVPITVASLLGKPMCFFGGGYLRLFPYTLIRRMADKVIAQERPVVFYIHPREIDPAHPRLAMPLGRRFKTYIGLKSTRTKLEKLLRDFSFTPFNQLLSLQN